MCKREKAIGVIEEQRERQKDRLPRLGEPYYERIIKEDREKQGMGHIESEGDQESQRKRE